MAEEIEVTTVEKSHPEQVVRTTKKVTPQVQTEHPQKVFEKKKVIFRSYQVIWYVLGFAEILLGFRLTLKAIGANPFSGFVSLIYGITGPLSFPFSGIIQSGTYGNSVFEWSTIFGALVYFLIAWGLVSLLQLVKPVSQEEVEQEVDKA